jgi:hypothetical protein
LTTTRVLCFHCRLIQPAADGLDYPFTTSERQRLALYRAAVRAGLYSDHPAQC